MSALSVKSAKHIKSHILEVEFSDGESRVIDFAPFIFLAGHLTTSATNLNQVFLTSKSRTAI